MKKIIMVLVIIAIGLTSNLSAQITKLNVCVDDNYITLESSYGYWSGIAVSGNKFYPALAGIGIHVLTAISVESTGKYKTHNIFVCVYPPVFAAAQKKDAVYGINLFIQNGVAEQYLSWKIEKRHLKNDNAFHAIYIFGIDQEDNLQLIDSVPNMCDTYSLTNKEIKKYKSFFVGYQVETKFLRSNEWKP